MPQIANRKTKLGNLLKAEFMPQHGYEREVYTVQVSEDTEIGMVVKNDGDGTYSPVVAADVTPGPLTDDVAIVIDNEVYTTDATLPADLEIACLAGGPGASGGAIVVKEQLKYGDALSVGEQATVVDAIEARGIRVATQV